MNLIGFDIETEGDHPGYGLQPFRASTGEGRIKAVSFDTSQGSAGWLYPSAESIRPIIAKASGHNYLTGWNVTFDASWLVACGLEVEVLAAQWLDAMLLWRHWIVLPEGDDVPKMKRKQYSLEAAMREFYPEYADFKNFKDFDARDAVSLQRLLVRNKGDAKFTRLLAEFFFAQLNHRQQCAALLEARCIPMVARANAYGLQASRSAAVKLDEVLERQAQDAYAALLASGPEVEGVNLGSPKQLQQLLYSTWGLPIQKTSKKSGDPSTDKYALFYLSFMDPRAKLLKELREAKNNRTKYAQATIKSLDYNEDGRVRPRARVFGTYSGRMTYASSDDAKQPEIKHSKTKGDYEILKNVTLPTGIALHQWKRGRDFRQIIQAPEGFDLVEFDFAGQEFRWMAFASGDETMLGLCAPGEDAHGYMGSQIAQCDYRQLVKDNKAGDPAAANMRKCGKFCNLSYQYRVGPKKAVEKAHVEYEMDVSLAFIKQTQAIYKQSYPGVERYWRSQIITCSGQGYAETFAGRRVQLEGSWSGRDAWALESTAINYPIQGTGGDQKYLGLAVMRNILPKYGAFFYYELHDGLFFICPKARTKEFYLEGLKLLSNLPYRKAWGIDLPIMFPVDGKVGPSWGELKEPDWK